MGISAWLCGPSPSTYTATFDNSLGIATELGVDKITVKTSVISEFSDIVIPLNKKVQLSVTLIDLMTNFWELEKLESQ
ncbi:MAG: hypothetical protein AB7S75_22495 [Desulfococcaceae bacterium]